MSKSSEHVKIEPNPYPSVSCDIYGCRTRATWRIGHVSGPRNLCLHLCDDCMRSMLAHLPAALGRVVSAVGELGGDGVYRVIDQSQTAGEPVMPEAPAVAAEEHRCPECGKVFKTAMALRGHSAVHRQ